VKIFLRIRSTQLGISLALIYKISLKPLVRDKHSSLFCCSFSEEVEKRFITLATDLWNDCKARLPCSLTSCKSPWPEVFLRQHAGGQQHPQDNPVLGSFNSSDSGLPRFATEVFVLYQNEASLSFILKISQQMLCNLCNFCLTCLYCSHTYCKSP
jgi:hypothetical protein